MAFEFYFDATCVRKIAPQSGSGFGLGLALELGLRDNFPNKLIINCQDLVSI